MLEKRFWLFTPELLPTFGADESSLWEHHCGVLGNTLAPAGQPNTSKHYQHLLWPPTALRQSVLTPARLCSACWGPPHSASPSLGQHLSAGSACMPFQPAQHTPHCHQHTPTTTRTVDTTDVVDCSLFLFLTVVSCGLLSRG